MTVVVALEERKVEHPVEDVLGAGRQVELAAEMNPEAAQHARDRVRLPGAERASAEDHVLQHLDEDAAQAEHCDRAEHRVAVDAEDALHAALQLLGNQNALDARGGGRVLRAPHQGREAVAHPARVRHVQQHAADFGFVDDVG